MRGVNLLNVDVDVDVADSFLLDTLVVVLNLYIILPNSSSVSEVETSVSSAGQLVDIYPHFLAIATRQSA